MAGSFVAHFFGDAEGGGPLLAFVFLDEGLVVVFGVHVVGPSVGWEATMVDVGYVARKEEYFSLQG